LGVPVRLVFELRLGPDAAVLDFDRIYEFAQDGFDVQGVAALTHFAEPTSDSPRARSRFEA
jgi:hypothetical protein